MKRIFAAALAVLMCMALALTAVAEKAPGALPISDEKITLRVFNCDKGNAIDYETNEFVKWAEEVTNIHIEWMDTGEDPVGKLNLMLSTGTDLPDIITAFKMSNAQQVAYGEAGIILKLNDFIDRLGENVKWIYEHTGNAPMITAPDGSIYGVTKLEESYQTQYSQKMWINQPWLDALNLPMPTTTEEFYNTMVAFKTQDPNGNGIADEVPLSGAIDGWHNSLDRFLMNAFIYNNHENRLAFKDGELVCVFNQPEWREGIRWLAKMYAEGLIDSEVFTQDSKQEMNLVENGDVIKLGASPSGMPSTFANPDGENIAAFQIVPPLTGLDGFVTAFYNPTRLSNRAFITSACQYPEEAFRFLDFLLSEEATLRQHAGVPDVDWVWAKDGEIGLNGKQAYITLINNLPEMNEQNQGIELLCNIVEKIAEGKTVDASFLGNMANLNDATDLYVPYKPERIIPTVFMTMEDSEAIADVQTQVLTYGMECFAKFVVGEMDVEADWDEYVQTLTNMGIDQYVSTIAKYVD